MVLVFHVKGLLLFMSRAIFKLHAPTDQTLKDMKTGEGGLGLWGLEQYL